LDDTQAAGSPKLLNVGFATSLLILLLAQNDVSLSASRLGYAVRDEDRLETVRGVIDGRPRLILITGWTPATQSIVRAVKSRSPLSKVVFAFDERPAMGKHATPEAACDAAWKSKFEPILSSTTIEQRKWIDFWGVPSQFSDSDPTKSESAARLVNRFSVRWSLWLSRAELRPAVVIPAFDGVDASIQSHWLLGLQKANHLGGAAIVRVSSDRYIRDGSSLRSFMDRYSSPVLRLLGLDSRLDAMPLILQVEMEGSSLSAASVRQKLEVWEDALRTDAKILGVVPSRGSRLLSSLWTADWLRVRLRSAKK
jgi:hypothetical protein